LKKNYAKYIFQALGQTLQSNPRIALYCWFEFLLPTISLSYDQQICDNSIRFIEILYKRYNKNQFKVPLGINKEYYSGPGIANLISYINSDVSSKDFKRSIRELYPKIILTTVFFSALSPGQYFRYLLRLANTPQDENIFFDDESQEQGTAMSLNILAYSLIRDTDQSCQLINKYYISNMDAVYKLLLYISYHWKKLTLSITENRRTELIQEITNLCDQLLDINTKLKEDTYISNSGQPITMRSLGIQTKKLEIIKEATVTFQKSINKTPLIPGSPVPKTTSPILPITLALVLTLFLLYILFNLDLNLPLTELRAQGLL